MSVKPNASVKLAIVVVNYRTGDLVADLLQSLAGKGGMPDRTKVIVVDGASNDGSADKIAASIATHRWSDRMEMLPLNVNGGFAFGNNRGIEHAIARFGRPEYVLLLNPDTVVRPGSLSTLVSFMDAHPDAGIAGSRLEDPDGTPQACAFRFPSIAGEFESEARFGPITRLLKRWCVLYPTQEKPSRADWVSGASMIIRDAVLGEIGTLDEDYFLYYEELDFCLRAARAGWTCWHVPASRVIHLVGQSTRVTLRSARPPRLPPYWFRSRNRYFLKHHGLAYAKMADIAWAAGHLVSSGRRIVEGRASERPPHLFYDFLRHCLFGRQPRLKN